MHATTVPRLAGRLLAVAALALAFAAIATAASPAHAGFDDTRGTIYDGAAEALKSEDVLRGCNPPDNTRLCPDRSLTRAEMASLLARAMDLASTDEHFFSDVARDATHARNINALRAADITRGCGNDTQFCPQQTVTREQMASFLKRMVGTPRADSQPFWDVSGTHADDIADIAAAGFARGCGPGRFCPSDPVTRGEAAIFIARGLGLISTVTPREGEPPPDNPWEGDWEPRHGWDVWDSLAQCESNQNWSINTGNGFYGGLQFRLDTWQSVGGSGYPHQASREEQIYRGDKLQARSGWGQWPHCSSALGLR